MLDESATTLSDDELNRIVNEIHLESPTLRAVMVHGRLRTLGYQVSRDRVRSALSAADPLSVTSRWMGVLTRRQPYSVAGPNSLWHIGEYNRCGTCVFES